MAKNISYIMKHKSSSFRVQCVVTVGSAVECRLAIERAGFESPFAVVSELGHFDSFHDAPVHSAV